MEISLQKLETMMLNSVCRIDDRHFPELVVLYDNPDHGELLRVENDDVLYFIKEVTSVDEDGTIHVVHLCGELSFDATIELYDKMTKRDLTAGLE